MESSHGYNAFYRTRHLDGIPFNKSFKFDIEMLGWKRGEADYAKNRNRILSTGINIWEYEGGYSYHGKSILIDDDLSVIGSFNMDMRSAYLDTELMLVIRSKDINKQLEEGMMEYERVSRQVLENGTYRDPYHVKPIELTKKRQRKIFLVQHLLGWARYLF